MTMLITVGEKVRVGFRILRKASKHAQLEIEGMIISLGLSLNALCVTVFNKCNKFLIFILL